MVLIVDDEPIIAETLGLIFNHNGFPAEVVHSADEAIAFATLTPPDLVLCDIEMPFRDGLSLMDDLGRDFPQCPILVLTGAHRNLGKIRQMASQLRQQVSIIVKPCQPEDLLRAAATLLQASQLS